MGNPLAGHKTKRSLRGTVVQRQDRRGERGATWPQATPLPAPERDGFARGLRAGAERRILLLVRGTEVKMAQALATTKMSSRGQVVIPEAVRTQLGLKPGSHFVVVAQDDVVLLKVIEPPELEGYAELRRRLGDQARRAGLRERDIPAAIARARGRR